MNKKKKLSLSNITRIEGLIEEAKNELSIIEPKIERLEKGLLKLEQLREKQKTLKALILNLQSVSQEKEIELSVINSNATKIKSTQLNQSNAGVSFSIDTLNGRKVFIPEVAISNAQNYLREKNNINYEIYKAVVSNMGTATSKEIKHYLVKNGIKQPKNGQTFDDVPLKEITSRINYLVRRGLLIAYTPGAYSTAFGWEE